MEVGGVGDEEVAEVVRAIPRQLDEPGRGEPSPVEEEPELAEVDLGGEGGAQCVGLVPPLDRRVTEQGSTVEPPLGLAETPRPLGARHGEVMGPQANRPISGRARRDPSDASARGIFPATLAGPKENVARPRIQSPLPERLGDSPSQSGPPSRFGPTVAPCER